MNKTVANALRSTAVLTAIAVVCVGLLAVCNMFFPKYKPNLDAATAALVNTVCPTGQSDADAYEKGFITMLADADYGASLEDYNKTNKDKKASILAVYGEPKGLNAGAYVVECSADGRDGEIVILIAYRDGGAIGATVKKQGESFWGKVPENLFEVIGSGKVDLVEEFGSTGATVTLSAIERAVKLSAEFALEYNTAIRKAISKLSTEAGL